jgi:hypothetical protein
METRLFQKQQSIMKDEQIEILVEEASMKNFLSGILPKILPDGYQLNLNCFIREHQGKQDLKKSIPIKIRAFKHYKKFIKVIIIHDQDSSDCKVLKAELQKLANTISGVPSLVRIACKELEAWYIGDIDALEAMYPQFKANRYRNWSVFKNPDICNASDELRKLIPRFQKGIASKEITKHINLDKNKSKSFNHLITGIKKFLN